MYFRAVGRRVPGYSEPMTYSEPPAEALVVRSGDPRCAELDAAGYIVVAESWGARLRLADAPDLAAYSERVTAARRLGYRVAELPDAWAGELARLEGSVAADYPQTPATPHRAVAEEEAAGLWRDGFRVFGATAGGALVAVTVVRAGERRVETEFTSVSRAHRRRGLAAAVKSLSILAFAGEGHRTFGTGGAGANAGSRAMNEALGYRIEERWLSYEPQPRGLS